MKNQTRGKSVAAKVLAKIGENVALGGAGDPTHWAFFEFEVPKDAKEKIVKKNENSKSDF